MSVVANEVDRFFRRNLRARELGRNFKLKPFASQDRARFECQLDLCAFPVAKFSQRGSARYWLEPPLLKPAWEASFPFSDYIQRSCETGLLLGKRGSLGLVIYARGAYLPDLRKQANLFSPPHPVHPSVVSPLRQERDAEAARMPGTPHVLAEILALMATTFSTSGTPT